MPLIDVNRTDLKNARNAAKDFLENMDDDMMTANLAVGQMLAEAWAGDDAAAFEDKWSGVYADGSVSAKVWDAVDDLSYALRKCENLYKEAQSASYSEVHRIETMLDLLDKFTG